MRPVPPEKANNLAPLFGGWQETLIFSYFDGYHGRAWADDADAPKSARIIVADFCFLAGVPDERMIREIPEDFLPDAMLMAARDPGWAEEIARVHGERCKRTLRYAIKKEKDAFDREKLQSFVGGLPPGYELKMIDEPLYYRALREPWSRDFCANFNSWEDFSARGLGVMALWQAETVSGASSYTAYRGGIEIQVDTRPEFRRRGLALSCCAKLILACLERGLYPSWDAAGLHSVALAEKLGYRLDHPYETFAVDNPARRPGGNKDGKGDAHA